MQILLDPNAQEEYLDSWSIKCDCEHDKDYNSNEQVSIFGSVCVFVPVSKKEKKKRLYHKEAG